MSQPARAMAATAAALIIGDELLSGKIQEENVFALAKTLRGIGVRLMRVNLIGDDLEGIAEEITQLCAQYDVVFTSGGVGPTHDDLTIDAVAAAFGVPAEINPEMEALLQRAYGARYHEGHRRMALVPQGAELIRSVEVPWPTIRMKNVWVLPGVPEAFRMKLPLVREFLGGAHTFLTRAVYTNMDEGDLKASLDQIVAEHPEVSVGSYPRWRSPEYKTKVTFDAAEQPCLDRAVEAFLQLLPPGAHIRSE